MKDLITSIKAMLIIRLIPILVTLLLTAGSSFAYTLVEYFHIEDENGQLNQAIEYLSTEVGVINTKVTTKETIEKKTIIQSIVKQDNIYTIKIECN